MEKPEVSLRNYLNITILFLLSLCAVACSTDDGDDTPPPPPIPYTTLVYMMADNSMDKEVNFTISQLKEGARHGGGLPRPEECRPAPVQAHAT